LINSQYWVPPRYPTKLGLTEGDAAFCVARKEPVSSIFGFNIYSLRMEGADLSETLLYTSTHGIHIPENKSAGSHRCEDVISQRHDAAGNYLCEIRPSFK
jgi:hypothetical protein